MGIFVTKHHFDFALREGRDSRERKYRNNYEKWYNFCVQSGSAILYSET